MLLPGQQEFTLKATISTRSNARKFMEVQGAREFDRVSLGRFIHPIGRMAQEPVLKI
jgi:hypothetical protein